MRLHRFLLRPLSPWATPLRSDTLYGLLLWRIAERRGNGACRDTIMAFCEGTPPFVLSSALPEGRVFAPRLPPVPRARFRQWVEEEHAFKNSAGSVLELTSALQAFKRFRKQAYLPLEDWRKQAGNLSVRPLFTAFCARDAPQRGPDAKDAIEPHVAMDRRGGALEGALYFNRLRWFRQDARLHLYARTDAADALRDLLAEVGELGFGKDAATGKGRFAVEKDPDFQAGNLENDGPDVLLLSVCAAPDMADLEGWYAVETKRGKVWGMGLSPFKNPLLLLREGSLLRRLPRGPFVLKGIHPQERIVQITYPLALPCRMAEEV